MSFLGGVLRAVRALLSSRVAREAADIWASSPELRRRVYRRVDDIVDDLRNRPHDAYAHEVLARLAVEYPNEFGHIVHDRAAIERLSADLGEARLRKAARALRRRSTLTDKRARKALDTVRRSLSHRPAQ